MNLYQLFHKGVLILSLLLAFLFQPTCIATELSKTVTKEIAVNNATQIAFKGGIGNLIVETWDKPLARIEMRITVDGDEKDIQSLYSTLEAMAFSKSGNSVEFDSKFYKNYKKYTAGKTIISLKNGSKIKVKRIKVEYVLLVPPVTPLSIYNRYCTVKIPDMSGELSLDLYQCEFDIGKIDKKAKIKLHFGSGEIASVEELTLDIYDGDITISQSEFINAKSKFSELHIIETGSLIVDSYDDHIKVDKHRQTEITASYSDLVLASFEKGSINISEGTINAGNVGQLKLSSKFTTAYFLAVENLSISEFHQSRLKSDIIGTISAHLNYSHLDIGELQKKMSILSSQEDEILVSKVNQHFSEIDIESRYTKVELHFAANSAYLLNTHLKSVALDFIKDQFTIQKESNAKQNTKILLARKVGVGNQSEASVKLSMLGGKAILR